LTPLLATSWLDPFVNALQGVLSAIHSAVPNYGWSLIILAALVKLVFWPLNTMQFKSMLKMQQLQPKIAVLRERFKNDKERLNTETMALYKESGANPAAGCLPMLLQAPILFSVYWLGISDKQLFSDQGWLWIGTKMAASVPHGILAASLAQPDYVLLALYIVSMYFSIRSTTPAIDPAQAQQQKIMAFISPVMIGYFGFKYAWPSALILYWLSFNIFTMAQQLYLIRRYHTAPAGVTLPPAKGAGASVMQSALNGNGALVTQKNGASSAAQENGTKSGSRAARRRRSSRR
jgi:YidC/Oxa1 family membrane protein insertase